MYYMFIDVQKTHTFDYLMQRAPHPPPRGIWRVHTSQFYLSV